MTKKISVSDTKARWDFDQKTIKTICDKAAARYANPNCRKVARLQSAAGILRKGFGGLYGAVKTVLEQDPVSGQWFVLCNERKTTLQVFLPGR